MSLDRLWAPWRLGYVSGTDKQEEPTELPGAELLPGGDPDCFICRAVASAEDRANLVVHRGEATITVINRYPYNNGHLLVAPARHWGDFATIPPGVMSECMDGVAQHLEQITRLMKADGFNVGLNLGRVAGAGLPGHLHWHIVPRWDGDTNFMPVLAGTRAIPQSLDALWELLASDTGPDDR